MTKAVTHSLVRALAGVPDFSALDDRTLLKIVGASANLTWSAGSTIFEEGADAEALYIVLSGRVRVFEVTEGEEHEVAEMGPGDSVGEFSLLLDTAHSLNAEAVEDAELMVLGKESFLEVLASRPDLAATFSEKVEARRVGGSIPSQPEAPLSP